MNSNMYIDFCEECMEDTPLDQLSADGFRCAKCDPEGIAREGNAYENTTAEDIPDPERCLDCGGKMQWCTGCKCYTQTCCVDWGTCMCS